MADQWSDAVSRENPVSCPALFPATRKPVLGKIGQSVLIGLMLNPTGFCSKPSLPVTIGAKLYEQIDS